MKLTHSLHITTEPFFLFHLINLLEHQGIIDQVLHCHLMSLEYACGIFKPNLKNPKGFYVNIYKQYHLQNVPPDERMNISSTDSFFQKLVESALHSIYPVSICNGLNCKPPLALDFFFHEWFTLLFWDQSRCATKTHLFML